MKKHFQYARYLIRHKWFVFRAGLLLRVPLWPLIIHDWSKFLPCEWRPYAEWFYGKKFPAIENADDYKYWNWRTPRESAFKRAFLHHVHLNPHHWEHWVRVKATQNDALPMPDHFVREMVADWAGAGCGIDKTWDIQPWWNAHKSKIILHDQTRHRVESLLEQWSDYVPGLNRTWRDFDLLDWMWRIVLIVALVSAVFVVYRIYQI